MFSETLALSLVWFEFKLILLLLVGNWLLTLNQSYFEFLVFHSHQILLLFLFLLFAVGLERVDFVNSLKEVEIAHIVTSFIDFFWAHIDWHCVISFDHLLLDLNHLLILIFFLILHRLKLHNFLLLLVVLIISINGIQLVTIILAITLITSQNDPLRLIQRCLSLKVAGSYCKYSLLIKYSSTSRSILCFIGTLKNKIKIPCIQPIYTDGKDTRNCQGQ